MPLITIIFMSAASALLLAISFGLASIANNRRSQPMRRRKIATLAVVAVLSFWVGCYASLVLSTFYMEKDGTLNDAIRVVALLVSTPMLGLIASALVSRWYWRLADRL